MYNKRTFNGVEIPPLILGTYRHTNYSVLDEIVKSCLNTGIVGFDTSPSYGTGNILSEILHCNFKNNNIKREDVFISTKIDPWQMQDSNGEIEIYVNSILEELNLDYIDQLLIHWPIPEYLNKTWESFISVYKSNKVRVIGVCNIQVRHLENLAQYKTSPMVVQNERHPLRTDEKTLKFCINNNIIYEAYSPVGQMRKQIQNSETLQSISSKYNKSIGQIILRWQIQTGSIPVFMTTKTSRINEYSEVFNFQLEDNDLMEISSLNKNFKIFIESPSCPGF